jgi:hypothetical protein
MDRGGGWWSKEERRQYVWQGLSRVMLQSSLEEVRTVVGKLDAGVAIDLFVYHSDQNDVRIPLSSMPASIIGMTNPRPFSSFQHPRMRAREAIVTRNMCCRCRRDEGIRLCEDSYSTAYHSGF